jgi:dCTP deaminase
VLRDVPDQITVGRPSPRWYACDRTNAEIYKEAAVTTLSNNEIAAEIAAGRLIHNADPNMLEGASYQLRMGDVYYDLSEDGRRFALQANESVLIKPGHRVVLITSEELDIPPDILARVVSKGSLFSIGLSAVATYADPGFAGNLGVVTQNISDRYIELPQHEPIAKADFTRLTSPTTHPYQGQHGFQLGIWPIKAHLQKHHSDVAQDPRVLSEKEEALALLPTATRTVIQRIERSQRWTDFALVVAILVNAAALFLVGGKLMDTFYGIVGNLVASAVLALGVVYGKLSRRAT